MLEAGRATLEYPVQKGTRMKIRTIQHHHDDIETLPEDHNLGSEISETIGDLFIGPTMAPVEQWAIVAKALRVHGLKIVEE